MNTENLHQKRIALLLSGGVDSAVALHLLASQGIRPDCFYIRIGPDDDSGEWDCSMEEDMEMATTLCRRYGVTLEVVDCHRDYWDEVTRYTMESVRSGRTPNPDVMCNRMIKFGAFDRKRGHDYDLIATGHYAQTEIDENGVKWLTTSPDPVKDQTDFLAQLYDWQLEKALFPIGHLQTKFAPLPRESISSTPAARTRRASASSGNSTTTTICAAISASRRATSSTSTPKK